MKENLRERRMMKEEERLTAKYMKEQQAIEEAMKSKYAGVSTRMAKKEEKKAGRTDKLRRRNDLKDLTMERRRIKEELILMRIEDALSLPLRDIDKRERQRKLLAQQLGLTMAESLNEEDEKKKPSAEETQASPQKKRKVIVAVEVPDWLRLPPEWDNMTTALQNKYVIMHQTVKMYELQAKSRAARDQKLLDVVKRKNLVEYKDRSNSLNMNLWTSELAYMVADEECKEAENNLIKLKDNVRRLTIFCQQKGEEELKLSSVIKEKEEIARRRDRECDDAKKWLEVCAARARKRSKLKRKVEANCLWVDSDSVLGFMQRFRTERLRARLYWSFFREVIYSVICRAEIIATERKLMHAQEGLSANADKLIIKTTLMKSLWREYQREEFMRMKRSAMNKKIFPKMRRETLLNSFTGWVRFFYWNRGHKEAFAMKYEVLKRKIDLERQFRQQLRPDHPDNQKSEQESFSTIIQRHRDRTIECKCCHMFYLESQNTSISCLYHFGTFSIACPQSCSNPGLNPVCIAHRKRRWTCCDSGDHKAIGCARRYHTPPDSDPVYDLVMKKIGERDSEMMEELNSKLSAAEEENWLRRAKDVKRMQVAVVEKEIGTARATAERYHKLKLH
jgi:hypothetical protein